MDLYNNLAIEFGLDRALVKNILFAFLYSRMSDDFRPNVLYQACSKHLESLGY